MTRLMSILGIALLVYAGASAASYPWLGGPCPLQSECVADIAPPDGFTRVEVDTAGFAHWLRAMPLKPDSATLRHFDGRSCPNQGYHYRVVDIDTGERDLQQCADAVIRLRAEFLYSRKLYDSIAFNFTNGDKAAFSRWARGDRPRVNGNHVSWRRTAPPDSSYQSFRKYLDVVFTYAGTYSLAREMVTPGDPGEVRIGDVFIQGGFPGHVLIVIDLARDDSGRQAMLLAQSFMPAHDVHIVRNLRYPDTSPWYVLGEGEQLLTRYWTFDWTDLRRFGRP